MRKVPPIIIFISIIIIVLLGFMVYFIANPNNKTDEVKNEVSNKEEYTEIGADGTKINISSKLQETKKLDGLEIGNINLIYTKGTTTLTADVFNTNDFDVEMTRVKITLIDKTGDDLISFEGLIKKLEPEKSTKIDMSTNGDYTNAYNFIIEKSK